MESAAVPRIRLDDLRHTHATLLLADSTRLNAVSERLGYSMTGITLDNYAHALPDKEDDAATAFDRAPSEDSEQVPTNTSLASD